MYMLYIYASFVVTYFYHICLCRYIYYTNVDFFMLLAYLLCWSFTSFILSQNLTIFYIQDSKTAIDLAKTEETRLYLKNAREVSYF